MSVSLTELREKCRRENHEANIRTMFFSSRVSIYITYLLAKTNISADVVTYSFTFLGIMSSAIMYMPSRWAPLLSFVIYRIHVILDVVDGEVARFRGSCSSRGAYLDYVTHYFVYSTMAFGCGVNAYLTLAGLKALILGFAVSFGLILNMASKDCWYRANYREKADIEASKPLWKGSKLTLLLVKISSINTFLILFALAALLNAYMSDINPQIIVLAVYAVILPCFSIARVIATMRFGSIPRRAAWYK